MAKILIADDSETVRIELRDALESVGHQVISCNDGDEGLAKAESETGIDLVISDYNMPGLDGLSMIKKIKASGRYDAVPFAMLTTESSKDLKEAGKATGVIVWIVKPFEKERLLTTIGKIFEKFPPKNHAAA